MILENPRTGPGGRLRGVFGLAPKALKETPETLGYVIGEDGQKVHVHRGPIRHESLSDDQLRRIGRLHDVLGEAYPMTLPGWIDGFMRDAHPEPEIQMIEARAVVYERLAAQACLSREEKRRLYALLCAVSAGSDGPDLASLLPADRGLPHLETIIHMYRVARQSGSRP